jgi:hypothetical protein
MGERMAGDAAKLQIQRRGRRLDARVPFLRCLIASGTYRTLNNREMSLAKSI